MNKVVNLVLFSVQVYSISGAHEISKQKLFHVIINMSFNGDHMAIPVNSLYFFNVSFDYWSKIYKLSSIYLTMMHTNG